MAQALLAGPQSAGQSNLRSGSFSYVFARTRIHKTKAAAGDRRRASDRSGDCGRSTTAAMDARATVAARDLRRDRPSERAAAGESNSSTAVQQ